MPSDTCIPELSSKQQAARICRLDPKGSMIKTEAA
jgi:hypothetical protein